MTGTRPLNVNLGLPKPNTRRSALHLANGNTTFAVIGDAATVTGTAGSTFPAAAGGDPSDYLVSLTSGAVSGNQGAVHGALNFRSASRMLFQAYVRPGPVITVARAWVGAWNVAVTTILGTDTPGAGGSFGFGFRRSTAIPDANWKAVVSSGAADTVVDTGIVYAASTQYELEIRWEPAVGATFFINGQAVANITATLPAGVLLRMGAGVQTIEAVAKQFDVGWMYGEKE